LANTDRIFEDKLQQGKSRNVINRDLGNMQHRRKALNQQTEAPTEENVITVDEMVGLLNQ